MIAGTIDFQRHFHTICETNEDFELYEKNEVEPKAKANILQLLALPIISLTLRATGSIPRLTASSKV
jgi:hypothetical protein